MFGPTPGPNYYSPNTLKLPVAVKISTIWPIIQGCHIGEISLILILPISVSHNRYLILNIGRYCLHYCLQIARASMRFAPWTPFITLYEHECPIYRLPVTHKFTCSAPPPQWVPQQHKYMYSFCFQTCLHSIQNFSGRSADISTGLHQKRAYTSLGTSCH